MIVVDASLAVKWIKEETGSVAALRFAAQFRDTLCAPDLLFSEVASALVRTANEHKPLRDDMHRALLKWTGLWSFGIVAAHRITTLALTAAAERAFDLGHPLADCLYLALAIEQDCDLATCDAKFAARGAGHWPRIRLLESYA